MPTTMRMNQQAIWLLAAVGAALSGGALAAEKAAKPAAPSSALASWTLSTTDTKLTLGVGKDQQLYIEELSSPGRPVGIGPASPRLSVVEARGHRRRAICDALGLPGGLGRPGGEVGFEQRL